MKKPSILFINRVYPPVKGATGRMLADLAEAFAGDGWDVSVVTTGPAASAGFENSVFVHRVRAGDTQSLVNYMFIWLKLFFAAHNFKKTQLIVTMTDPPLLILAGFLIARKHKASHIHWCQDLYPDLLPRLGFKIPDILQGFLKAVSLRCMKKTVGIVVIGRCMGACLAGKGISLNLIQQIPNWADKEFSEIRPGTEDGNPDEAAQQTVQLRTGKSLLMDNERKFRVLYAGNIGRAHPLTTLIDAAKLIQDSHPEIEITFVGEGGGYDVLARERTSRGLENIKLLPPQPAFQLREMMESGDVHLISMDAGMSGLLVPSKLYSGIAAQRPIIFVGPADSEIALVIQEYKSGEVVAQGNARALADTIIRYRMDGDAWFSAHQGASAASGDFNRQSSLQRWIKFARTAIRSHAA